MAAVKIIGTGSYVPEKILSNSDLEKMVETSDEWIVTRTGMKERRIAREDEATSDMGKEAALRALADAGIAAADLDLIIVATLTPDYPTPSTACVLQAQLGAVNAAACDLQAACTGYLYTLSMVNALVASGTYRHVLLVASDKLSAVTDYTDRNTCILFGDGASAAVISKEGKGLIIRDITLGSDGELAELLLIPAGGAKKPVSQETLDARFHYLQMEGREVFKHAVRRMESACNECLSRVGMQESDISWLVPHQANIRIIESLAKRFALGMERVYVTIHKYGNTSASSIGIALDELLKGQKLASGENLLLTAFGAGLTWGAAVLTHE